MAGQRYQELFRDVDRWVLKARQHLFVAEVLTAPMRGVLVDFLSDRVGASRQAPEFLEKAERVSALSNARALYFGLALENAAKGRQILLGHLTVQSGNPKRLRTDHNVLEHVRQCGVSLNDEETEFLRLDRHGQLPSWLPPPRTCRVSKKFANSAAFNPSTITRAIAGMHTSRVVTAITP